MILSAPSSAARGIGEASAIGPQRSGIPCSTLFLKLVSIGSIMLAFFSPSLRLLWFCRDGNSRDEPLITAEALADDDSVGCDFVFPNVFAVIATAHLHDQQNLAKCSLDLHVSEPDNVVGEKRDIKGAERRIRERFFQLQGAQNRDADSGEGENHP